MFDYAQSAADALELLREFGTSIAITRRVSTPVPNSLAVVTVDTPGTLTAVVLPGKATTLGIIEGNADDVMRDALTKGKARFILAAASDATFRPDTDDLLTLKDGTFRIIGVTALAPTTVDILYKIGAVKV